MLIHFLTKNIHPSDLGKVFGYHPTRNTSFWPIWGGSVDPGRIWLGSRGVPLRTAAVGRTFQHQLVQVSWSHLLWRETALLGTGKSHEYIYIYYIYTIYSVIICLLHIIYVIRYIFIFRFWLFLFISSYTGDLPRSLSVPSVPNYAETCYAYL